MARTIKKYACAHPSGKYHADYLGAKTTAGRNRAVFEGRASRTRPGGLTKAGLMKNKRGRIVSKKRHAAGLKNFKYIKGFKRFGKKK